ncbi:GNAT family N-acetyltransferase [Kineococcus sp. NBC_00420]|uniref:GNAT family N-acetyltransferase n=1 Tax=unclassified Kineococcus TaxID=2621656 RepID=UPI002E21BDC4
MDPGVVLRGFRLDDAAMAVELSSDPYVPLTGSLPANADEAQARAWVERQQGRLAEGIGWSFAIADVSSDRALGSAGLWFTDSPGVFTVGYGVVPSARGRGVATEALALLVEFAGNLPAARRLLAHVEPWNSASIRVAERVGFRREGRTRHEIGGGLREVLVLVRER